MSKEKGLRIFYSLLSGILLILSFPPFNFFPFAWAAFIPLFFSIQNKSRSTASFLIGVSFFLFLGEFLFPLSLYAWWAWLGAALYGFLLFTIWGWMVYPLLNCSRFSLFQVLAVSSAYICLQIFAGLGPLAFPWVDLGYSQWKFLPIVQITSLIGVNGLSFFIIFCNLLLYWGIKEKKFLFFVLGLLCFFLPTLFGIVRLQEKITGKTVTAALIQTDDHKTFKWSYQDFQNSLIELNHLILKSKQSHPDLIILPETAVASYLNENTAARNLVRSWALKTKTYLIVGTLLKENGSPKNSLVLVKPNGAWNQKYIKIWLVPFGEYVPDFFKPLKQFIPVLRNLANIKPGKKLGIFHFSKGKFGAMICYESSFGWISRKLTLDGAKFLVVSSNDAWFEKTPAQQIHASMAVFRAVENKRSFVQVGNTGISCVINPLGRILLWSQPEKSEVLIARIPLESGLTVYDFIGRFLSYFWVLGTIVISIFVFAHQGASEHITET